MLNLQQGSLTFSTVHNTPAIIINLKSYNKALVQLPDSSRVLINCNRLTLLNGEEKIVEVAGKSISEVHEIFKGLNIEIKKESTLNTESDFERFKMRLIRNVEEEVAILIINK